MTRTLVFFAVLAAFAYAAPRPQGYALCSQIPENPYANQIGVEFLEIPGCDGTPATVENIASTAPTGVAAALSGAAGMNLASQTSKPPPANPSASSYSPASGVPGIISASNSSSSTGGGGDIGQLYKSSITRYGQGPPGTPGTDAHCQAHEGSCGNNPKSGYTAAASQFLYFNGGAGVGSEGNTGGGSGGKACGTCWKITGDRDSADQPLHCDPIVVLITNECAAGPANEPPNLCGMSSLEEPNHLGMSVNIDICMDSGGTQAFWGNPPWGTAKGTTQQVDCSEWCGVFADGTKSGPPGCEAPAAPWAVTT